MPLYSDVNQFTPKKTELVYDLQSIYQSIGNILATPKNTRLFLPEFGSTIEDLLFEPMDAQTEASLYDAIVIAIDEWEPRVSLDYSKSSVTANYDEHRYDVLLTFKVRGLTDTNFHTYAATLYTGER